MRAGALVRVATAATGAEPDGLTLETAIFVNSAGLGALPLAAASAGWPATSPDGIGPPQPPRRFARGNYFALAGRRAPFTRLVYPVPTYASLGVHLTLDLAGQARFGPDLEWIDAPAAGPGPGAYAVNAARAALFAREIRRYWPGLPEAAEGGVGGTALVPAYAGIRAKLQQEHGPACDFAVARPTPAAVHLLGIESPGLTSSLALAAHVAALWPPAA